MRRMLVCVSVSRIELLLSLALICRALPGNVLDSHTISRLRRKRTGRICVTIASLRESIRDRCRVCTGKSRFFRAFAFYDHENAARWRIARRSPTR